MNDEQQAQRTVMVFLRDRERDIRTGFKTRTTIRDGRFDDEPWRQGQYACDCVRGQIIYGGDRFPCGTSRFVVEQVIDWDTGETWHLDAAASERGRRVPAGEH